MEHLIIAHFYNNYKRRNEHHIRTKRLKSIPQSGDEVILNGKVYRIIQVDYDYEVSQSSGVFIYDVIVE